MCSRARAGRQAVTSKAFELSRRRDVVFPRARGWPEIEILVPEDGYGVPPRARVARQYAIHGAIDDRCSLARAGGPARVQPAAEMFLFRCSLARAGGPKVYIRMNGPAAVSFYRSWFDPAWAVADPLFGDQYE